MLLEKNFFLDPADSVKNWGLDRRASLRRHEDEVLANENAYAHRTEQERNKKILNNFEMDATSYTASEKPLENILTFALLAVPL